MVMDKVFSENEQNVVLALIVSVLLLLAMSLFLVWLNIERTKLGYQVRQLQLDVDARTELNAKLGVERDHLLSPHYLGKKAAALGLFTAQPGQTRRMGFPPIQNKTVAE